MSKNKSYSTIQNFDLNKFESVEDKRLIHEFDNKNSELDLDNLKDKYILNQLR